tara:strand:- start:3094 stop:3420 length:327 start_codon:yes stop_codon:yes gene_type:complete
VFSFPIKKNQILYILYIYIFISLTPLRALEKRDYHLINMMVKSCYKDIKSCDLSLSKIHSYQKKSAINNNFPCQTRLLGLEANLIMAMNYNLRKEEAKSIIKEVKKYC